MTKHKICFEIVYLSVWFVVEQIACFKHNVGFQNAEVNYFTNINFIVLKQDINE